MKELLFEAQNFLELCFTNSKFYFKDINTTSQWLYINLYPFFICTALPYPTESVR